MLKHYDDSEIPEIQRHCLSASANTIEPLMVLGKTVEAIPRIHRILQQCSPTDQEYAIMHLLLWLTQPEAPVKIVTDAIHALSPEVVCTWSWADIQPFIVQLPAPKQTQAQAFMAYFDQHTDSVKLKSDLGSV